MSLSVRIQKSFPNFSLDVALTAAPGITAIFGPSGAGKTVTLDCIAGAARPGAGRILLNEQIYFDAEAQVNISPERRHCGYVFQDGLLFPHMTVRDNLRFVRGAKRDRIKELLHEFELEKMADLKPPQLSGGERQRAALARALVGEPRLLMLDEPSRGLDYARRERFHSHLADVSARLHIPILLVSHDISECFKLARHIYVLSSGRVLQGGSMKDVVNKPASVGVVDVLGLHRVFAAEVLALDPGRNSSRLRIGDLEIAGPYFPGHLIGDRGLLCIPKAARIEPADAQLLAQAKPENMLFISDKA